MGAILEDGGAGDPAIDSGAAYVFTRDAGGAWNQQAVLYVFVINYFLYLTANIIEYSLACIMLQKSLRRDDYLLYLFLPLVSFYTGMYLRIVRTYAYIMEFLHGTSYLDKWNPWKVSRIAKREEL